MFSLRLSVLLGLVAVAAVGTTAVLAAWPNPAIPAAAAVPTAPADGDKITVSGRVVDPDGRPIVGANVHYPGLRNNPPKSEDDLRLPVVAVTGADGRFKGEVTKFAIPVPRPIPIVATADGYGIGWTDAGENVAIALTKEHLIKGRLVDTEGKPLVGVRIEPMGLYAGERIGLNAYLTAWKREQAMAASEVSRRLDLPLAPLLPKVQTDEDGRFVVRGIGVETVTQLRFSGPSMARTVIHVVNRPNFDPAPINAEVFAKVEERFRLPGNPPLLYGPTVALVAGPTRVVQGVVRDLDTGKPVAGMRVWIGTGPGGTVTVVTDIAGQFRLTGLPKVKEHLIHVDPDPKRGYLGWGARLTDAEGLAPIEVNPRIARGVTLVGKVTDKATGQGVRGGMRLAPLPDNVYFAKHEAYQSYKTERLMYDTNADGTFRLTVIPGTGLLMLQAQSLGTKGPDGTYLNPYRTARPDPDHPKYFNKNGGDLLANTVGNALEFLRNEHAVKVLDLKPDAGEVKVDLVVDPGLRVKVLVRDAEGKPVTGATVSGVTDAWPICYPVPAEEFTAYALDPSEPRTLLALHPERNLAGKLTLRGDEKEPPVLTLGPAGTFAGRLLDTDGRPIAGADIGVSANPEIGSELYRTLDRKRELVRTDAEGRFRVSGVIPGMKFSLSVRKGKTTFVGEPRIGVKEVKPGEVLELGDVKVKPFQP